MTQQSGERLKSSIRRSARDRKAMLTKFGFVPFSILSIGRGELSKRMYQFAGDASQAANMKNNNTEKMKLLAEAGYGKAANSPAGRGAGRGKPGLSIMPAELVAFFAKYYSRRGKVYLDPFMGQGVQMQVAASLGMHYYGYDLCEEFYGYIDAVRKKIDTGETTIQATLGDSKSPDEIPDDIGDFSFHSPPYWDIEDYGDHPEQLGTGKTYWQFLQGMQDVAAAWLPKFKQGAYHVVNVNDFRKNGRYYCYHADLIERFTAAGWVMTDMWIIQGLVGGMAKAFAVNLNLQRICPKVHEYAIVFRKP